MSIETVTKPIILESGYNTSGLYAFLISMFYQKSESVNKILNMDTDDIGILYFQEFLKSEVVSRLQMGRSLSIDHIDRFRNLLYSFGWRKEYRDKLDMLLADPDPVDIYRFLFIERMRSRLMFERVNSKENNVENVTFDIIEITHQNLVFSDTQKPVINLSGCIRNWVRHKIIDEEKHNYSCRFKELPYLIPVIIDPEINDTEPDKKVPIDIKEAIGFQNMNDQIQKIFTWDIQSIILYDDNINEYLTLVKDDVSGWHSICQSSIPANRPIDMTDPIVVNEISKQIRAVFYKIK